MIFGNLISLIFHSDFIIFCYVSLCIFFLLRLSVQSSSTSYFLILPLPPPSSPFLLLLPFFLILPFCYRVRSIFITLSLSSSRSIYLFSPYEIFPPALCHLFSPLLSRLPPSSLIFPSLPNVLERL